MSIRFGLIDSVPRRKVGRKSYFSPEGKVALMFLKSYTRLSAPKLMEQLNANIHYQIFCGIRISPVNPLTNYKLIDDIILELSKRLKIQAQQESLAEAWKPYSFSQKGWKRETTSSVIMAKKELARVRATAMEGSLGTQKEYYGLKRINGRIGF